MTPFKALRLLPGAGSEPERAMVDLHIDQLSPGDMVIRVAYSSINFKDALASKGRNAIVRQFPRVGGIDLVGNVVETRDQRFQPGDPVVVHGFGLGVDHDGGHAHYARVPSAWALKLPAGLTPFDAAAIGVAGYTAALSIHLMELNGLTPENGPVLVNGATGGVASLAIDMLAGLGYRITASTGKTTENDYLLSIGASEVIGRSPDQTGAKPLDKGVWAGAVDSVGGSSLAWLTRTMLPQGVIAAFGNASGPELNTTVLPFILRGVRLIGVNANSPMALRTEVWHDMTQRYRPRHLDRIVERITLAQVPQAMDRMLASGIRGRLVVDMGLEDIGGGRTGT